jgi:hypothetical protein
MSKSWNWTIDLNPGTSAGYVQRRPKPRAYPYDAGFLTDLSEAFRTARPGHYSIWIVSPPGYSHSRCFEEVALGLQSAFLDLGFRAPVVSDPDLAEGRVVVLGPHLLSHVPDAPLPGETILFNLEQVADGSVWFTDDYRDRLKRHVVWDYSSQNVEALRQMGIDGATLCPIGYAPPLTRIEPARNQDIDVLFIGSVNERRRAVLNQLREAGIAVHRGFNVYGRDRDTAFSRAKIILNMHMYDAKVFEVVRVSYLLANRLCVVSETGADPELESPFKGGVAFAPVDKLPETCKRLLENHNARQTLADEGFQLFSAMYQRRFLEEALRNSGMSA